MDNEFVKGADELVRKLNAINDYINQDAPDRIGTEAVNHFKDSFQNEGFTNNSLQKWSSRKTKRQGGTNSQGVLSKSGDLADSIEFRVQGNTIIISTDKKYAEIHNNGGEIIVSASMKSYFWSQYYMAKEAKKEDLMNQWRAMALSKVIKIPARQFIGESDALNNRIKEKIERDLINLTL